MGDSIYGLRHVDNDEVTVILSESDETGMPQIWIMIGEEGKDQQEFFIVYPEQLLLLMQSWRIMYDKWEANERAERKNFSGKNQ